MYRDAHQGQAPLGKYIRQLRRERGLTQSELGGESYSKSYVSALERGSILPSQRALQFFSAQLQQPLADFEQLLEADEPPQPTVPALYHAEQHDGIKSLLDLVLSRGNMEGLLSGQSLPQLSDEALVELPLAQQADYLFLKGLVAQEQGELNGAQLALASALALAPALYQPAILDALGTNAFQMRLYQSALHYHHNALQQLEAQALNGKSAGLLLQIELHNGDDYVAFGDYKRAIAHYEQARAHLRASNNMSSAALIYQGLGYSTYASIASDFCAEPSTSFQERERALQSAIHYLIQSRTLYQTSQDLEGTTQSLLMHVRALLDFSKLKWQSAQERQAHLPPLECASILEDVVSQCRQMLLEWQLAFPDAALLTAPARTLLYTATAQLVHAHVQRASLARVAGYKDTAARECAQAAAICQEVLNASAERSPSWQWVETIQSNVVRGNPALPHIPAPPRVQEADEDDIEPAGLAEIYLAAGEVAEEMGRAATSQEYMLACYACADEHFQAGLNMARLAFMREGYDPGILARHYQHYFHTLEERIRVAPETAEDVVHATLKLLKVGVAPIFTPLLPSKEKAGEKE